VRAVVVLVLMLEQVVLVLVLVLERVVLVVVLVTPLVLLPTPDPVPDSTLVAELDPVPVAVPEPVVAVLDPPLDPDPEPASTTPASVDAQVGIETSLSSMVTAPFRARTRPLTVAPVSSVMLVRARMLPVNAVVVPRVAELPTCQ